MKNIIYYLLLTFLCVYIASCTLNKPIYTKQVQSNPEYKISFLFEHDGCKVYRFNDNGENVYFTSCTGEISYKSDSTRVIRNTTRRD